MSFPRYFLYQCWHKTNYEMKTSAIEPLVRPGKGGMAMGVISILPWTFEQPWSHFRRRKLGKGLAQKWCCSIKSADCRHTRRQPFDISKQSQFLLLIHFASSKAGSKHIYHQKKKLCVKWIITELWACVTGSCCERTLSMTKAWVYTMVGHWQLHIYIIRSVRILSFLNCTEASNYEMLIVSETLRFMEGADDLTFGSSKNLVRACLRILCLRLWPPRVG